MMMGRLRVYDLVTGNLETSFAEAMEVWTSVHNGKK